MPRIRLANGETLSRALNRVVKEQRGTSRPFITLLVEEDGVATIASNMNNQSEVIDLLTQVAARLRGN